MDGKTDEQTSVGDWQEWDRRWPAIGAGPNKCLYTRDAPASQSEFNHRVYWLDLWELIRDRLPNRSVELGAGRGTTSQYLAAQGVAVDLVDLSATGLQLARDNWVQHGMPPPGIHQRSATDSGLRGEAFDLVLSVGLLEHFEHPRPVLEESRRLLVGGGLMWHVIVGGSDHRVAHQGMIRTCHPPAAYEAWARNAGLRDAACRRIVIDGVMILTGRR